MATHKIEIYPAANQSATWKYNDASPPGTPILVSPRDTINFTFPDGSVETALLLVGPRRKESGLSPFRGGAQFNIFSGADMVVSDTSKGLWGFSVTFSVIEDGVTRFHFLPDPELEVGSIPGSD